MADSDPVIIPYKVINRIITTLYGIITKSLPPSFCERGSRDDLIIINFYQRKTLISGDINDAMAVLYR